MDLYALGGAGILVLALAVMFARFGIGAPQVATRGGGDARRSRNGRPRLD
jgi:hypothetical protein